jgi:hypothetical protein
MYRRVAENIHLFERIMFETLYKLHVCERVKFIFLGIYNNVMIFIKILITICSLLII